MPKVINYPKATLKSCLQLAQAVDDLGGECSAELAADKLNKKMSGAFNSYVASAVRFGLILNKRGQLEVTNLYREYKLAYTTEIQLETLRKIFLSPQLFESVFKRFEGKELPVSHFEKLLIREFEVPDQFASRVSKYFIEGAKQCHLLGANNTLSSEGAVESEAESEQISEKAEGGQYDDEDEGGDYSDDLGLGQSSGDRTSGDRFSIRITGPGINSKIVVNEVEDLFIVDAMLRKVRRAFGEIGSSEEEKTPI